MTVRPPVDGGTVLVTGASSGIGREFAAQLAARTLGRTYWTLVRGRFSEDTAEIDAPIGRDPRQRMRMGVVDGGRAAQTDLRVLERLPGARVVAIDHPAGGGA